MKYLYTLYKNYTNEFNIQMNKYKKKEKKLDIYITTMKYVKIKNK